LFGRSPEQLSHPGKDRRGQIGREPASALLAATLAHAVGESVDPGWADARIEQDRPRDLAVGPVGAVAICVRLALVSTHTDGR
jgi:hypothetical protein